MMKGTGGLDRWLWVLALPLSLVWLTLEESSRLGVMALALPWAILTARHAHRRYIRRPDALGLLAATSLGGALVAPLAVVLMSMKIALHVHPLPDFQADDAWAAIQWTPVGALAGFLLGAGLLLLRAGRANP
jgi:hypothetical protein